MKKTAWRAAISQKSKPVKVRTTCLLRTAIYCRAHDTEAIESQKACLTEMLKANPDWTPAGVFADIGPASSERPEFQNMLRRCMRNEVDLILTESVSRFVRGLADYVRIIKILRELGVAVIFVKENLNTLESDEIATMIETIVQMESESISRNSLHTRYLGVPGGEGGNHT